MDVIARSETTKQSPGLGRFEIAASAFGLLAMTTPHFSLDGVLFSCLSAAVVGASSAYMVSL